MTTYAYIYCSNNSDYNLIKTTDGYVLKRKSETLTSELNACVNGYITIKFLYKDVYKLDENEIGFVDSYGNYFDKNYIIGTTGFTSEELDTGNYKFIVSLNSLEYCGAFNLNDFRNKNNDNRIRFPARSMQHARFYGEKCYIYIMKPERLYDILTKNINYDLRNIVIKRKG